MPVLYTEDVQDYVDQAAAEAAGWEFIITVVPNSPLAGSFVFDSGVVVDVYPSSLILRTPNNGYYTGQHGFVIAQNTFAVVVGQTYTVKVIAGQGPPDNAWYSFATLSAVSGATQRIAGINGTEDDQELSVSLVAGAATLTVTLKAEAGGSNHVPYQDWRFAHLTIEGPDDAEPPPPEPGTLPTLFTPEINWEQPLVEEREFESTTTRFYGDVEQRQALMDEPHRRLTYLITTGHAMDSALFEALIASGQAHEWWVPYWRSAEWLTTPVSSGATTLALDTLHKGYEVAQGIMFWRDPFHAEVAVLSAVTSGLLTFSALVSAWAASGRNRAKVMPVYRGLLAPSEDVDYPERTLKEGTVTFDLLTVP